jgi:hypothetical protein
MPRQMSICGRIAPSCSRRPEPQPNVGPLRVFAKIKETEHSPFSPNAIKRNFSNERTNADGGEPNTTDPAAERDLSAARISNI